MVAEKYKNAGAEQGKYIVIHGIESDSKASMQSRGDSDSLLPIQVWAEIANGLRYKTFLDFLIHMIEIMNHLRSIIYIRCTHFSIISYLLFPATSVINNTHRVKILNSEHF